MLHLPSPPFIHPGTLCLVKDYPEAGVVTVSHFHGQLPANAWPSLVNQLLWAVECRRTVTVLAAMTGQLRKVGPGIIYVLERSLILLTSPDSAPNSSSAEERLQLNSWHHNYTAGQRRGTVKF